MSGSNAIRVEVAFGGMTFSMAEVADPGLAIEPSEARALCEPGQKFIRRPIIGSRFTGAIDGLGKVAPCPAVIPALAGQALDRRADPDGHGLDRPLSAGLHTGRHLVRSIELNVPIIFDHPRCDSFCGAVLDAFAEGMAEATWR